MYVIDLTGKVAIVTGAGAGLAKQTALSLADAGADVVIGDVNLENVEATAAEVRAMGKKAFACRCDVSKFDDMKAMFELAKKEFGHIDIVVNAAGIGYLANVEDATEEGIRREIDINIMGVEFGDKLALQYMKEQRSGAVINFASVAGRKGTLPHPHYAMTKAAVINLTKSYALYSAKFNIRYNSMLPGIIRTAMWDDILAKLNEENGMGIEENWKDRLNAWVPMGVPQEPVDIANAVVFLASDKARYITGQTLNVDGGQVMY